MRSPKDRSASGLVCTDLKIEMRPEVPQVAAGRIMVSEQVPQPENQCLGNSCANLLLIAAFEVIAYFFV